MMRKLVAFWLVVAAGAAAQAGPACPAPEEAMQIVRAAGLSRAARSARFEADVPTRLYERAVAQIGEPQMMREGKESIGVIVAELPVVTLWKAVNDDPHHALDGKYLPVQHSEVIAGIPGAQTRDLFQYYQQMGVGRWWVSRVWMSESLFESSQGRLWELVWVDRMAEVDRTRSPIAEVDSKMTAVHSTEGAWVLMALGERCASVEYYSRSEPGGVVGVLQPLLIKRALRDILEGIVRLASEHVDTPHPGVAFIAPDGKALD